MPEINEIIEKMPPFSKYFLGGIFFCAAVVTFGIVNPMFLILDFTSVF